METVEQYAAVREEEAANDTETRDWASDKLKIGCVNRALALLSISSIGNANDMHLFQYGESVADSIENEISNELDEEDVFLTREGIEFTRSVLL